MNSVLKNMLDKYLNRNTDISGKENLQEYTGFFDKKYLDPFVSGYFDIEFKKY